MIKYKIKQDQIEIKFNQVKKDARTFLDYSQQAVNRLIRSICCPIAMSRLFYWKVPHG